MDAIAALGIWGTETTFDRVHDEHGQLYVFRIPKLPAAEWIIATRNEGHLSYVPGLLLDDDRDRLMDAIEDGDVTIDEIVQANRDVIETVSGWPWFSAGRLIGTLLAQWETVGGLLVLAGVDPESRSLGTVLSALYAKVCTEVDKETRSKWVSTIVTPPAELMTGDKWDEEAAHAALLAMMAQGGGGIPDS